MKRQFQLHTATRKKKQRRYKAWECTIAINKPTETNDGFFFKIEY